MSLEDGGSNAKVGSVQQPMDTSLPPDLCLLLPSPIASPKDPSNSSFRILSPQVVPAVLPSGEVAPSPISPASTPNSSSLSPSIPQRVHKKDLLLSLSDREILCPAYNSILRRSRRPWGVIPNKEVHFLSREEQQTSTSSSSTTTGNNKKDWTFRRVENLRVWSAALRLRYNIQSSSSNNDKKLGLGFDPKMVARKEDGWLEMLEEMIGKWLNEVIEKIRDEGVET